MESSVTLVWLGVELDALFMSEAFLELAYPPPLFHWFWLCSFWFWFLYLQSGSVLLFVTGSLRR